MTSFAAIVPALLERAQRLADAHLANRGAAHRTPERRWRNAALLWPLFAKD